MSQMSGGRALVTGAAGDIGRACAVRLAGAGADVVLADLPGRTDDLDETARRCRTSGGTVTVAAFDVTDSEDVERAVEAASGTRPPDLLVNAAGYQGRFVSTPWYPSDDVARVMAVNVTGLITVTGMITRRLVDRGAPGAVVNLASRAARGSPNTPAYCASKAAVIGFTRAAALDLAPHGIRINSVSPAFIGPGEMWDRQVHEQASVPSQYYGDHPATVEQQMLARVPMRRLGSVDEVASVVLWLLTDAASYVTGEDVLVSGGITG